MYLIHTATRSPPLEESLRTTIIKCWTHSSLEALLFPNQKPKTTNPHKWYIYIRYTINISYICFLSHYIFCQLEAILFRDQEVWRRQVQQGEVGLQPRGRAPSWKRGEIIFLTCFRKSPSSLIGHSGFRWRHFFKICGQNKLKGAWMSFLLSSCLSNCLTEPQKMLKKCFDKTSPR